LAAPNARILNSEQRIAQSKGKWGFSFSFSFFSLFSASFSLFFPLDRSTGEGVEEGKKRVCIFQEGEIKKRAQYISSTESYC
jgi:hypothetical protein